MSQARFFGMHVVAYCQIVWPNDPGMAKSQVDVSAMSFADFIESGSHKYIPADRLTEELGMRKGSGVFGYLKFSDGSYLLKCCNGLLASWAGDETKPEIIGPITASEFQRKTLTNEMNS